MTKFAVFQGKKKKLGVIFKLRSPEGGFFIVERVSFFSYEIKRKIGNKFRIIGTRDSKPEAIAFARKANKAIKLARKAGRVAKKAGLITGAALVKVSKLGFRFLEKATRPKKKAKSKKKKRKQKRRKQKRRKQKRR